MWGDGTARHDAFDGPTGREDMEAVRESRERDTVSLNIEQRRAEREEFRAARLKRENARRAAAGLEPLPDLAALEEAEAPDIVLNEAAGVVADMVQISLRDASPDRHTAQNRP